MKNLRLDRLGTRMVLACILATVLYLATLAVGAEGYDVPAVGAMLGGLVGLGISMADTIERESRRLGSSWNPLKAAVEVRSLGLLLLLAALGAGVWGVETLFEVYLIQHLPVLEIMLIGWVSAAVTVLLAPVWLKGKNTPQLAPDQPAEPP